MTTDRRSFLQLSAMAGGALAFGVFNPVSAAAARPTYRGLPDVASAPRPLDILILGGTGFTGPFQLDYALARGHRSRCSTVAAVMHGTPSERGPAHG
jgi:2'-hydroxyisoflavone reductase